MKKILQLLIITLILFSCSDTETHTDINNQFSIDVPKNWMVQSSGNEYLSLIRFMDTSQNSANQILFDVYWEPNKTDFTPDFRKTMDSIAVSKGWSTKNTSFKKISGFDAYTFDIIAKDSLGNFDFALENRYLNKSEKDGTLYLTITRWQQKLSETDSIQVEKILKSLQW